MIRMGSNKIKSKSKFTIDNISYIFIITGIIVFFVFAEIFKNSETITDTFSNIKKIINTKLNKSNLNYIYPDQLEQICGNGTKPGNQSCVPDDAFVANQLIKQNFIRVVNNEIVFTPDYAFDDTIVEVPKWFVNWTDNGTYSCERLISNGICNISGNNCNAPCRCGDCAGWRGGNLSDCDDNDIGSGRVFCNLSPGEPFTFKGEPDKCECTYGHCAINGICVSPYIMDGSRNSKRCCPTCAWKSPDKLGGCAGGVKCDPDIQCEESIVELPGVKFLTDLSNPLVIKIDQLCTSITDTGDCYHPNHVNAMKRQQYIKVSPNSSNSFESLCQKDTNTAAGENEYECAMKCGNTNGEFPNDNTVTDQVSCSKRCLPKLWKWYPVMEEVDSGIKYSGGYYQSDELMRYLPSTSELRICPENTCETELNQPIDFTEFHNCTECSDCLYKYSEYTNNNGFQDASYNCGRCKQCILDQVSENGINYQVKCKNMIGCNTCHNSLQEVDVVQGLNYNECDTCLGADVNDVTSGCKIYTLDPYVNRGSKIEYHPSSQIYNHGADAYKSYSDTDNVDGYNPNLRESSCDYGLGLSFKKTCDNTLDGKIGWGDGYLYSVAGCTKTCNN